MAIKDFEHSSFEIRKENGSLKYQLEQKDNEIYGLKSEISRKQKSINKLQAENNILKEKVKFFKDFWKATIGYFQKKITFGRDIHFIEVAKELFKNGIFNKEENEIVNNPRKKVKLKENDNIKDKKKNRKIEMN